MICLPPNFQYKKWTSARVGALRIQTIRVHAYMCGNCVSKFGQFWQFLAQNVQHVTVLHFVSAGGTPSVLKKSSENLGSIHLFQANNNHWRDEVKQMDTEAPAGGGDGYFLERRCSLGAHNQQYFWGATWTSNQQVCATVEVRQWPDSPPEVSDFVARFCTLRESEHLRPCENRT